MICSRRVALPSRGSPHDARPIQSAAGTMARRERRAEDIHSPLAPGRATEGGAGHLPRGQLARRAVYRRGGAFRHARFRGHRARLARTREVGGRAVLRRSRRRLRLRPVAGDRAGPLARSGRAAVPARPQRRRRHLGQLCARLSGPDRRTDLRKLSASMRPTSRSSCSRGPATSRRISTSSS